MLHGVDVAFVRVAEKPAGSDIEFNFFNPLRYFPSIRSLFGIEGRAVAPTTAISEDYSSIQPGKIFYRTANKGDKQAGLIYCPTLEELCKLSSNIKNYLEEDYARQLLREKGIPQTDIGYVIDTLDTLYGSYNDSSSEWDKKTLLIKPVVKSLGDKNSYCPIETRKYLRDTLEKIFTILIYAEYKLPAIVSSSSIHHCYHSINSKEMAGYVEEMKVDVPDPSRNSFFMRNIGPLAISIALMTSFSKATLGSISFFTNMAITSGYLRVFLGFSLLAVDSLADIAGLQRALGNLHKKISFGYGSRAKAESAVDEQPSNFSIIKFIRMNFVGLLFISGGLLRTFIEFFLVKNAVKNLYGLLKPFLGISTAMAVTSLLSNVSAYAVAAMTLTSMVGLATLWVNFSLQDNRKDLERIFKNTTNDESGATKSKDYVLSAFAVAPKPVTLGKGYSVVGVEVVEGRRRSGSGSSTSSACSL